MTVKVNPSAAPSPPQLAHGGLMGAFVRSAVSPRVADGQRPDPSVGINYDKFCECHRHYVGLLEAHPMPVCGVLKAPEVPEQPDGCFMEDTMVYSAGCVVVTTPGHPSRQGEVTALPAFLRGTAAPCCGEDCLRHIVCMRDVDPEARLDGGDVCVMVSGDIFVGLSERTNKKGALVLRRVFEQHRGVGDDTVLEGMLPHRVHIIELENSEGLHLKCHMSPFKVNGIVFWDAPRGRQISRAIKNNTALLAPEGYTHLFVPDEEGANVLWLDGDKILLAKGFPNSKCILEEEGGVKVTEIDNSEERKADGALTCLSVLMRYRDPQFPN
eukprot:Nk52_evm20s234 gene=Nk52_evmTU20s234